MVYSPPAANGGGVDCFAVCELSAGLCDTERTLFIKTKVFILMIAKYFLSGSKATKTYASLKPRPANSGPPDNVNVNTCDHGGCYMEVFTACHKCYSYLCYKHTVEGSLCTEHSPAGKFR